MHADSDVVDDNSPPVASQSLVPDTNNEDTDDVDHASSVEVEKKAATGGFRRAGPWRRIVTCVLLPGVALILALGAGYLKWLDGSARESQSAAQQSVAAATDSTVAVLSYHPDTVDKDLTAARDRLTGSFRDSYTQLVHDVVIPGAQQKKISAVAAVPAAASVTASENHAVVLVFVDQTVTAGNDAPTSTASSIRITLDKVDNRWLISQFDPI